MKLTIASLLVLGTITFTSAAEVSPNLVKLSAANDDFGLQLLHRLELAEKQERGQKHLEPRNLLISPFSVSTVLSMLMAGSSNTTFEEIHNTLGFDKTFAESDIYSTYQELFTGLKRVLPESDKKNELHLANSIALQDKFKLVSAFENIVTEKFSSKIFNVNFETAAHAATEEINKWAASQTNGKIEKLFDQDLDALTVMVLLNAIYFKGTWKYQFEKEKTTDAVFTYNVNQHEMVKTMQLKGNLKYGHFDDGDLVELPYESDALSMYVYLPDGRWVKDYQTIAGQFARIVEHGHFKLDSRLAELKNASVHLSLPRFKIESNFKLKEQLEWLGVRKAFSQSAADFRRIDGHDDLYLADVVHKTIIEVNEEGSEAAAVTGGVVNTKSMPLIHELNANKPFLFLIRDNIHQVTLFAGVINKP